MEPSDLAIDHPGAAIGHNVPPANTDPGTVVGERLATRYAGLVARFVELELGCGRVPDPIASPEEAGLVTDFVAQCQAQLRRAESAHKEEKAPYLGGGRVIDGFFKRRCERLSQALVPVLTRLNDYRNRVIASEAARHAAARAAAEEELRRAGADEARHRAAAERLARDAGVAGRAQAAEHLRAAEVAGERAWVAAQRLAREPEPVRIEGDYGAVAYVSRSWSYEVVDLGAVPRAYLTLDGERVRAAIGQEAVRQIPGLRIYQREELRVRGAL
ncbi:MAG: hypothetical protein JO032_04040 [Alphaproteobacteria bacterium]|nr:hypothetical protein [Alphaproteobacteria bacterium]